MMDEDIDDNNAFAETPAPASSGKKGRSGSTSASRRVSFGEDTKPATSKAARAAASSSSSTGGGGRTKGPARQLGNASEASATKSAPQTELEKMMAKRRQQNGE